MTQVVTLEGFQPSPRYDGLAWTQARIEEGTASVGPWVTLETQNLSPVDADPTNPATRNFTTQLAGDGELWYRIVFVDADGDIGQPTYPVQNTAPTRPVYASTSELARLLRVSESARHAELRRVLESAAQEIDDEIGTADINGTELPYGSPPALAAEVNLERAVEHWQQMQSPFGIIGMGDMGATYTARDSWDRHAFKLAPLKGSWGIA
jgi:hypothetical protein